MGRIRLVTLGQVKKRDGQDERADDRQYDEDGLPAKGRRQITTGGRRQQGRDAQDQHQQSEDLGALFAREEIPDHGGRGYVGRAASDRLDEAKYDQGLDRTASKAADRCENVKDQSEIKRPLPPEAVEEGSVKKLAHGESDKKARERKRDFRDVQP